MFEPFELNSNQIAKLPPMGGFVMYENFQKAFAGEIKPAVDGDRLLYYLSNDQCVYILIKPNLFNMHKTGKVFQQNHVGLTRDIDIGLTAQEVSNRTSSTKVVIKAHVQFMIGVAKSVSTPIKITHYGLNAVEWLLAHQQQIPKWIRVLEVLVEINDVVKVYCPTLHKKILSVLFPILADGDITNKYLDKVDFLHRGAGNMFGKFGKQKVEIHVDDIRKLVKAVLKPVIEHCLKEAAKLTEQQLKDLGWHVAKKMAESLKDRITLTEDEKKKIIEEISLNASKIKSSFDKLEAVLDTV